MDLNTQTVSGTKLTSNEKILPRSAWKSEVSKLRIVLQAKQVLDRKYGSST